MEEDILTKLKGEQDSQHETQGTCALKEICFVHPLAASVKERFNNTYNI